MHGVCVSVFSAHGVGHREPPHPAVLHRGCPSTPPHRLTECRDSLANKARKTSESSLAILVKFAPTLVTRSPLSHGQLPGFISIANICSWAFNASFIRDLYIQCPSYEERIILIYRHANRSGKGVHFMRKDWAERRSR